MSNETEKDPSLSQVRYYVMDGFSPPVNEAIKPVKRAKKQLSLFINCIMYGYRVEILKLYRLSALELLHVNHPGISAMQGIARL